MNVKRINLLTSFPLLLDLGTAYSDEDFTITFISGKNKARTYVCSREGDEFTNCQMADSRHVLCMLDHYDLGCGFLSVSIVVNYSDSAMPSGEHPIGDTELVEALDDNNIPYHIELTQGKGDTISTSEMVWYLVGNIMRGQKGDKGDTGNDGVSISSVTQSVESTEDGGINQVVVTLSNGAQHIFKFRNGSKGNAGGLSSTEKANLITELKNIFSQLDHTHTVSDIADLASNYIPQPEEAGTEGQVLTLGEDGNPVWGDPQGGGGTGTTDYTALTNKPKIAGTTLAGDMSLAELGIQPAEEGKDLSSNDYTDEDKEKLAGIEEGAEKNPTDYVKEAAIADMETKTNAAATYQPKGEYAAASHTHTKSQITDFPDIPSTASEISTDEGISTGKNIQADLTALAANIGSLSDLETSAKSNLVAAINEAAQSGGSGSSETWELINHIVGGDDEASAVTINQDSDGNSFSLKKFRLYMYSPKYTGSTTIPTVVIKLKNLDGGQFSPIGNYGSMAKASSGGTITQLVEMGRDESGTWKEFYAYANYRSFSNFEANPSHTYYKPTDMSRGCDEITAINITTLFYSECEIYLYGVKN